MSLRYVRKKVLKGEHADSITSVAFSPDGRFLASAANDKKIVIWSIATGEAEHLIFAKAEVLCLVWPPCSGIILAGIADGSLVDLRIDETSLTASGFIVHDGPVQSLSMTCDAVAAPVASSISMADSACSLGFLCKDHRLATAASADVNIWHLSRESADRWSLIHSLSRPPSTQFSGNYGIEVTSVQWLVAPYRDCLVVSYLHHGILCWQLDGDTASVLWSIVTPLCGMCRVSTDNCFLVANNIDTGFDIHDLPSGVRRFGLRAPDMRPDMILPATFHDGQLVLIASVVGKLRLRRAANGEHIHTLRMPDRIPIQALDVFRSPASDGYMVAGGTGNAGSANYVQLWETIEE